MTCHAFWVQRTYRAPSRLVTFTTIPRHRILMLLLPFLASPYTRPLGRVLTPFNTIPTPSNMAAQAATAGPATNLDKSASRPYKCPFPACGRAFSRLEHQVRVTFPSGDATPHTDNLTRLDTSERIPERSHLLAPFLAARNVSLVRMS